MTYISPLNTTNDECLVIGGFPSFLSLSLSLSLGIILFSFWCYLFVVFVFIFC